MPPRPDTAPEFRPDTMRSLRVVTVSWLFGSVFFTAVAGAPVTLFAEALGATAFTFGLLAAAPFAASLLSLPAAVWSDYSGRRKQIFLSSLYAQRLLWIPLAILPPLVVWNEWGDLPMALGVFVGLFALMHCVGALGGPAWMSWMADVVPRRVRGRYFARRRQFGVISALPTALLVGYILDRTVRTGDGTSPQETVFWVVGGIFCAAAIFGIIDIALFHVIPHDPPPEKGERPASVVFRELAGSLGRPMRDIRFLAFAGFMAILTFAAAPLGQFTTLMLVQKMKLENVAVQTMLLVVPLLATLVAVSGWGRAVDRFGKKAVLAAGAVGVVPVSIGWMLVAGHATEESNWTWIIVGYVAGILSGLFWTAVETANFNYVLDLAGSAEGGHTRAGPSTGAGGGYVAVNAVIINVAGMAGGLTFGKLASMTQEVNFDLDASWGWIGRSIGTVDYFVILFAFSALLRLLAVVVFLPLVREDPALRHHRARDAVRFLTVNLYNNVQTALLLPVRMLRVRPRDTFRT